MGSGEATTGRLDFGGRIPEQLSPLGEVTRRPLFGGPGISRGGTIVGILFRGRVYLRLDDRSKGGYLARGVGPFRPNERQTLKSYYEVPPDVLADPEALLSWAREAIRAAIHS